MAGLYIHVPFRRAGRSYDDSYHVVDEAPDFERYQTALCRELRYYVEPLVADEPITTLYAGGGRASLLPLVRVRSIVRTVRETLDVSAVEEVTAEVSPADASRRFLHNLKRLGVNRLSLEVLSFSPVDLRAANAPHSATDACRALEHAREAGFETVSVDLLFGLPSQTVGAWEATLRDALDRAVPHITIMEATAPDSSSEEKRAEQLKRAMTLLTSEGYEQYELTHFARPGHRSHHQENDYAHGNYIGVGPSAESFWWTNRAGSGRARRWANVSDVDRYAELLSQRYPPTSYRQTLDEQELAREYILLRLRTDAGLDLRQLATRYGVDLRAEKRALLQHLRDDHLIHDDPDRIRLTPRGRLLTDAITTKLLPS